MRHGIAQKDSRGSCFYHDPSLPHLSMLGDQALASDNMTPINIELGNEDHFSLKSGKMCQHVFFHDCRYTVPLKLKEMRHTFWGALLQISVNG